MLQKTAAIGSGAGQGLQQFHFPSSQLAVSQMKAAGS